MKYFQIESAKELEPIEKTLDRHDTGDEEWIFVSKKSTEIELDGGKKCKVKLGVWVENVQECAPSVDTKDGDFTVFLFLVPDVKTLGEKTKKCVAATSGIKPSEVDEYDCWQYGLEIPCGRDEKLENITGLDAPKLQEVIKFAGDVAATSILGLIGFTLDQPINRIGENGWNRASEWVK